MLFTELVDENGAALVQVMDQVGVLRLMSEWMMVDQEPAGTVHGGIDRKITHPGGGFLMVSVMPGLDGVGIERDGLPEQFLGQLLQQEARDKTVQVTLVGEDDLRRLICQLHVCSNSLFSVVFLIRLRHAESDGCGRPSMR